jgi:gliding motility-associated-like protein
MQITYTGINGNNASYSWNFGNGVVISGSGRGPYQVFWPTPGTKSVCLQVSEGDCASPVRCQTVVVKGRPIIQINPVDDQCYPGNAFNFTVVGGPADDYRWDFGASALPASYQGTMGNPSPTQPVRYQSPGIKTVTVAIADDGCQGPDTARVTFEVVPEPSADFLPSTNEICGGGPISMSYQGSDPDNSQTYVWTFGPGASPSSSTLKSPTVAYNTPGTKTVTLTVFDGPCEVSSTQIIEVKPGPIVTAGPDKEFCEGDGGVELEATTSGGTQPYFYTWSCDRSPNCGIGSVNVEDPMVNPVALSPTESVTYAYFVTDVNGCRSNTDSVVVTVKAKPRVNAGEDRAICAPADSGIFLLARPSDLNQAPVPFTYQWSPSAGLSRSDIANPYARPDSTTIYTVTVISPNGCSSEATTIDPLSTVTVLVKDKPQVFAGPDTGICIGESIELQGYATSAGPNYNYRWTASPAGSLDDSTLATPIATPTQTTTYTLVAAFNGCGSDGDQVTITVNQKPTVSPGAEVSACLFEAYPLNASGAGSNLTYHWSPGLSLSDSTIQRPLATPEQTTNYSVYASSEFGCNSDTGRITLTIKPTPVVTLMAEDSALCSDAQLTLTASHGFRSPTQPLGQVFYRWYPGDFDFQPVAGQDSVVQVTPTRSGYIVVETVIASGECPTRDSIFLNVDPAVVAVASADTTRICFGSSTELLADGGRGNSTYLWTPATGLDDPTAMAPMASPDTTTTYVLAISEGICVGYDTLTLEVNPSPEADYFNSIATGCGGLEVTFMENAPGAIAYRWDFGDSSELSNEANPIHVYAQPGQYAVRFTAIGTGGCEETVSRQLVEVYEAAEADFTSVPTREDRIAAGTPIQFEDLSSEAIEWLWDFGDGQSSTEANPTHRYESPGQYAVTLTVTDSAGCTSSVTYATYDLFIPEVERQSVFTPNGDGLNDVFRIDYPNPESYRISIFDRWGRTVFEANAPSDWDGILPNGSRARDGVYLYTLSINGSQFTGSLTLLR